MAKKKRRETTTAKRFHLKKLKSFEFEMRVQEGNAILHRYHFSIGTVSVGSIREMPTYQRNEKRKLGNRIRSEGWNFRALGMILVEERPDGTRWILDGQQRYRALLAAGFETVPALIMQVESVKKAAGDFRSVNFNRTSLNTIDELRAELAMEDQDAIEIVHQVEVAGMRVKGINADRNRFAPIVGAVRTLKNIYFSGVRLGRPQALEDTLRILSTAYADDPKARREALEEEMIRGVGELLVRFNGRVDTDRLIEVLQRTTPRAINSKVAAWVDGTTGKVTSGNQRTKGYAEIVQKEYNYKLNADSDRRLPRVPWLSTTPVIMKYGRQGPKVAIEKALAETVTK